MIGHPCNKSNLQRGLLSRGKSIVAIFCLALLLLSPLYKTYARIWGGKMAAPVSIRISASDERDFTRIRALTISLRSHISELERSKHNEWIDRGSYVENIVLCLPKQVLTGIEKMEVGIGERVFSFTQQQIGDEWKEVENDACRTGIPDAEHFAILQAPPGVRAETSAIPPFKRIINWSGDRKLLIDTISFVLPGIIIAISGLAATLIIARLIPSLERIKWRPGSALLLVLVIVFLLFHMSPVLDSQLYHDDLVYGSIFWAGFCKMNNQTLSQSIIGSIKRELHNGRFLPVAKTMNRSALHYCDDVVIYKWLILLMVFCNVALFYALVKRMSRNGILPVLLLFFLPLFFQLRAGYHDAMLGYFGYMQPLFCFILGSVTALEYYFENRRRSFLAMSALFYTAALLTYEIAFPFILMYLYLICSRQDGGIWKVIGTFSPFWISFMAGLALQIYLRLFFVDASTQYEGMKANFAFADITRTMIIQLVSALPLSHVLLLEQRYTWMDVFESLVGTDFLSVSVLFVAIFVSLAKMMRESAPVEYRKELTVMGLMLYILPALPIALSYKYQKELVPGLGYLPVYLQIFGLLTFLGNMVILTYRKSIGVRSRKHGDLLLAFLFTVTFIVSSTNYISNKEGIEKQNEFSYPSFLLRESLRFKMLPDLSDGALVLFRNKRYMNYPVEPYEYLFYNYLDKKIHCRTLDEYLNTMNVRGKERLDFVGRNIYLLESPPAKLESVYIKLGKIDSIVFDNSRISTVYVSSIRYIAPRTSANGYIHDHSSTGAEVGAVNVSSYSSNKKYEAYTVSIDRESIDFDSITF